MAWNRQFEKILSKGELAASLLKARLWLDLKFRFCGMYYDLFQQMKIQISPEVV